MNPEFIRAVTVLSLGATLVGFIPDAPAQTIRRGPPIQFSDPRNPTVSTNVNVLGDRGNSSLRKLEEDLRQPFRMLERDAAGGSSRMLPRPPAGPVIQSPKVRELLDRQKNWVFVRPEEQITGLKGEEMLNVPEADEEGRDKSKMPVFERYYEDLMMGDPGVTNRAAENLVESRDAREEAGGRQEFADPARKATQAEMNKTEHSLRQLFQEDSSARTLPDLNEVAVMPDLFDAKQASIWQARAQESRLEQFKQTMQAGLPPTSTPTPSLTGALPAAGGALGGGSVGAATWGARSVAPPSPSPSPRPVAVPGASSFTSAGLAPMPSLPGASQPAYAPPTPARTPAPSPFMEIPKRKF